MPSETPLKNIFDLLFKEFGAQHWWPARSRFEVMVGAVLTQNTNWRNVERALKNLKAGGYLHIHSIARLSKADLSRIIRPAGYFNVKAERLKNLVAMIIRDYDGRLNRMASRPAQELRDVLLAVNGIGPETADSILLYAFRKPVFVVDAYTKRFLVRHNLVSPSSSYHDIQQYIESELPHDEDLFNEFHALIVRLGKVYCRPRPDCERCILRKVHYQIHSRCGCCYRSFLRQEKRIQNPKLGTKLDSDHRYICRNCV